MNKRSFMGGVKRVSTATIALAMAAAIPSVGMTSANVVNAAAVPSKTAVVQQHIEFKDLPRTHWAYESVQWGVAKKLVVGYEDGTYKPASQITEEEFVSVLARYVKDIDNSKLVAGTGVYWSQPSYDELAKYSLPLKGNTDKVAKKTGLSRGRIAQLIAAKNGFNLDERQAIYYMYENDISYGLIDGTLSYESYGKDKAVDRAQIPAFFQRLEEKGHTTFMGKPSPVKESNGIAGITGVPKDTTEITDKDFHDISDKVNPPGKGELDKLQNDAKKIAEKNGMKFDSAGTSFEVVDSKGLGLSYTDNSDANSESFSFRVEDYNKNKNILLDVLKATGKLNDAEIKEVVRILEVEHPKTFTPKQYSVNNGRVGVSPSGNFSKYSVYIGISK